jgi:hypothetical protein
MSSGVRKYSPIPSGNISPARGKYLMFTSLFVHVYIIIGTEELSMMWRGGN